MNGNVTFALTGLFAWAWAAPRWAGLIGGFGLAVKLAPGAVIVWAVRRRGVRAVAEATVVVVAMAVAGTAIVGLHAWRDFLTALLNQRPTCDYALAMSAACVSGLGPIVGDLLAGGLLLAALIVARASLATYSLCAAAIIVSNGDLNPISQLWLYATPPLTIAVLRLARRRRPLSPARPSSAVGEGPRFASPASIPPGSR